MNEHDIKAVIDVGSNSVILLVVQKEKNSWTTLAEATEVTALGEGVRTTGQLSESGMSATLSALSVQFAKARVLGATDIYAAATMAARMAKNADEFVARAKAQNTPIRVLSAEQEARLGFRAVAEDPIFRENNRISTVDVGGQSTELVTGERAGEGWNLLYCHSFPLGTLGLRETLLQSERLAPQSIFAATVSIDNQIEASYHHLEPGLAVSIGATGTNLVSIRNKMESWQPEKTHGETLDYEEISRAVGWMSSMTDEDRSEIKGIESGRERTLHIGALILERSLYALKAEDCRVSNRGWRYALLDHPLLNCGDSMAN